MVDDDEVIQSKDGIVLYEGMILYQKPVVEINDRNEVSFRWAHPRSFVLPSSLYPGDSLFFPLPDGGRHYVSPSECYSTEEGAITAAITEAICKELT